MAEGVRLPSLRYSLCKIACLLLRRHGWGVYLVRFAQQVGAVKLRSHLTLILRHEKAFRCNDS